MEGFTIIDAVVAVVIILSAILAYSRGFVREVFAILGWVAAAVLAFMFAGQAQPLIRQVPVLSDFLGDNCELSMIAAFAGVFAVTLIVVSIFTPLFSSAVQRSALGGIDQALGFLFGVARGVLLVAIAFVVYGQVMASASVPMVDDSRSSVVFAKFQESLSQQLPDDAPGWIVRQYENLVGSCGSAVKTITPDSAPATTTAAPGN